MTSIARYLHIYEMDVKIKKIAHRFVTITITRNIAFSLADAFIILYLISELQIQQYSTIIALRFGLQALLDYPTGSLGDLVGHKKLMQFAYLTRIGSISLLILASSFPQFLLVMSLDAIATSQESGALESWFDNQYQPTIEQTDPERKIYGTFQGKLGGINYGTRAVTFLVGGGLATIYSRKLLFGVTLIFYVITFLVIVKFMTDNKITDREFSISNYLKQMGDGLDFYRSSKGVFFFYTGLIFVYGSLVIWGLFVLFPYYEAYSTNDSTLGLLRSVLLITGFFWFGFVSKISRDINRTYSGLFLSMIIGFPIFFGIAYLHYTIIPPTNQFQLLSFLTLIIIFQIVGITQPLISIFSSRIQIELVPNEIRNSIYSLLPTLIAIVSSIISYTTGFYLNNSARTLGNSIVLVSILTGVGTIILGIGLLFLIQEEIDIKEAETITDQLHEEKPTNMTTIEKIIERN